MVDGDRWLSKREAAALLGVSLRTMNKYIKERRFETKKMGDLQQSPIKVLMSSIFAKDPMPEAK
jgi:predicted transcriptional regulator